MNKIDKTNLTDQTKIRLNKIIKIENYFNSDINQRKSCIKKSSKYVAASDYIDKVLIVLIATSGGVSIISFTSVVGAAVGIVSASFALFFSLATGMIKKYWAQQETKRKSMIRFLCWLKVNSIALKL